MPVQLQNNLLLEMNMTYRQGTKQDITKLKNLALISWAQYQTLLTQENWTKLSASLHNEATYTALLKKATCFVSETDLGEIIGMAFLIPNGNPTEIYDKNWCYIRLLTVDPRFSGQGIGHQLTTLCIDNARKNNEKVIALHTSEFMDAARHMYEKMGFIILKEIDQRLGKRYWLYNLDLTDEGVR